VRAVGGTDTRPLREIRKGILKRFVTAQNGSSRLREVAMIAPPPDAPINMPASPTAQG
jgi:hypothetical protein